MNNGTQIIEEKKTPKIEQNINVANLQLRVRLYTWKTFVQSNNFYYLSIYISL